MDGLYDSDSDDSAELQLIEHLHKSGSHLDLSSDDSDSDLGAFTLQELQKLNESKEKKAADDSNCSNRRESSSSSHLESLNSNLSVSSSAPLLPPLQPIISTSVSPSPTPLLDLPSFSSFENLGALSPLQVHLTSPPNTTATTIATTADTAAASTTTSTSFNDNVLDEHNRSPSGFENLGFNDQSHFKPSPSPNFEMFDFSMVPEEVTIETVERALALNRKAQNLITQRMNSVRSHQQSVLSIKRSIKPLIKVRTKTQKLSRNHTTPYFLDLRGQPAPTNSDALLYQRETENIPTSHSYRRWKKPDRDMLRTIIQRENKQMILNPLMEEYRLKAADLSLTGDPSIQRELDDLVVKTQEVEKLPDEEFEINLHGLDWEKISSTFGFSKNKGASDCQIEWINNLHPFTNKQEWTDEEDKLLYRLGSSQGYRNWSDIARQLNTNRPPVQVFKRYQRSLNPLILKREWDDDEDELLRTLVRRYGPKWRQVSSEMIQRTGQQCLHRWRCIQPNLKKGKWDAAEDELLKDSVKQHGLVWKNVQHLVPGRTDSQCRERYLNVLCPHRNTDPFTAEEDALLGVLAEKYRDGNGIKWSKVAAEIKNGRTDNLCWRRWQTAFPEEAKAYRAINEKKKIALPLNFVGREKERPTLTKLDVDASLIPESHKKQIKEIRNKRKKSTIKKREAIESSTYVAKRNLQITDAVENELNDDAIEKSVKSKTSSTTGKTKAQKQKEAAERKEAQKKQKEERLLEKEREKKERLNSRALKQKEKKIEQLEKQLQREREKEERMQLKEQEKAKKQQQQQQEKEKEQHQKQPKLSQKQKRQSQQSSSSPSPQQQQQQQQQRRRRLRSSSSPLPPHQQRRRIRRQSTVQDGVELPAKRYRDEEKAMYSELLKNFHLKGNETKKDGSLLGIPLCPPSYVTLVAFRHLLKVIEESNSNDNDSNNDHNNESGIEIENDKDTDTDIERPTANSPPSMLNIASNNATSPDAIYLNNANSNNANSNNSKSNNATLNTLTSLNAIPNDSTPNQATQNNLTFIEVDINSKSTGNDQNNDSDCINRVGSPMTIPSLVTSSNSTLTTTMQMETPTVSGNDRGNGAIHNDESVPVQDDSLPIRDKADNLNNEPSASVTATTTVKSKENDAYDEEEYQLLKARFRSVFQWPSVLVHGSNIDT